jgi:hypothetical protein
MKDYYKILKEQGFSDKEIAESFILPSTLTKEEAEKMDKKISEFIKEHKKKRNRRLSSSIKDNGYEHGISNKKMYTYQFRYPDILLIDDNRRDDVIDQIIFEFKLALQSTLFGGCWGHGTSTELKHSLKKYGKRKLDKLDYDDFKYLKDTGMLWEFYPDSPSNWEEIDPTHRG